MTSSSSQGPGVLGMWAVGILLGTGVPLASVYFPELTKEVTIGIDLGTTYSVVAVCVGGQIDVIEHENGSPLLPSWVSFDGPSEAVVGQAAKDRAHTHSRSTVFDAKRIIGRNFSDPIVQTEVAGFPFTVTGGADDRPIITVEHSAGHHPSSFSPEDISAMVLNNLKGKLEHHFKWRRMLGWRVKTATVSVPANFGIQQQLATLAAGKQAGFSTVQLITEPAAAALAYRLHQQPGVSNVLVFDFGGGTLDVALLLLDREQFSVITTAGDPHLGGEDIDRRLLEHLVGEFAGQTGVNLTAVGHKAGPAMERLRREAEHLKLKLSSQEQASVVVENVFDGKKLSVTVSRAQFEDMCADLFERALIPVREALQGSETEKSEIGNIVLVGGTSRIPKVRQMLADFFDGATLNHDVNPDEAVARGAALTRSCK